MVTLNINNRPADVDADPSTPMLWVLRDNLGLTGTKFGCGTGDCGACTVHVDGRAVPSCTLALSSVGNARITTSEHLAEDAIGRLSSTRGSATTSRNAVIARAAR